MDQPTTATNRPEISALRMNALFERVAAIKMPSKLNPGKAAAPAVKEKTSTAVKGKKPTPNKASTTGVAAPRKRGRPSKSAEPTEVGAAVIQPVVRTAEKPIGRMPGHFEYPQPAVGLVIPDSPVGSPSLEARIAEMSCVGRRVRLSYLWRGRAFGGMVNVNGSPVPPSVIPENLLDGSDSKRELLALLVGMLGLPFSELTGNELDNLFELSCVYFAIPLDSLEFKILKSEVVKPRQHMCLPTASRLSIEAKGGAKTDGAAFKNGQVPNDKSARTWRYIPYEYQTYAFNEFSGHMLVEKHIGRTYSLVCSGGADAMRAEGRRRAAATGCVFNGENGGGIVEHPNHPKYSDFDGSIQAVPK